MGKCVTCNYSNPAIELEECPDCLNEKIEALWTSPDGKAAKMFEIIEEQTKEIANNG